MAQIKRNLSISTLVLLLGGCTWMVYGPFGESDAQKKMEQSKNVYEACIAQNQQIPGACDNEKKAYEYDKERYLEIRSGWT